MTNEPENNQDLVVTHVFDAPVEKVWQVWTEERFVRRWWGVNGFTNILAQMDVREGGVSHVGMRASKEYGGKDYYNTFKYTHIVPNKLIEYLSNFASKEGHDISPIEAGMPEETPMNKKQRVEFQDLGNDKTKVIITEFGWRAGGEMIERSKRGLEQTLGNIDKALSG